MPIERHVLVRATAAIVGVVVLIGGAVAFAAALDDPATVSTPADRVDRPVDNLAVVFDVGDVDRAVIDASDRVAQRVGGASTLSRSGSLGMQRLTRDGAVVHAPPPGYLIPTVFVALPSGSVGRVMGSDVSAVLDDRSVVMNELTAGLTGAAVGDVIVLQGNTGAVVSLTITGIRPYDQIGWAELVFTYDVAARLGANTDTRTVIYGFDDRAAFDQAIIDEGLVGRRDTKVNRSWDPPNPDATISTARTKVALGEPWYRIGADGSIAMHPTWKANNLTDGRVLLNETIRVRAECHVRVVDDFRAAFAEVAAVGLGWAIEVGNANAFGGCYVPRYSRTSGFLSRHTYGMALDTNTQSNCGGCTPRMHCDVVRIFRKHGFAWGGNFRRPDGMHFEWVGERRDQIPFASTYCPNLVTGDAIGGAPEAGDVLGLGALLAGDAGMPHDHP